MNLDKLTIKSQESLAAAMDTASEYGHAEIQPLHILLALLKQENGAVESVIRRIGAQIPQLVRDVETALEKLPRVSGGGLGNPGLGKTAQQLLDAGWKVAQELGDEYLSTEHILLGLLQLSNNDARTILDQHSIKKDSVMTALKDVRGNQSVTDQNPEGQYDALEKYTRDLTRLARSGKLDPVIGRDDEVRRVIQVLSRRTKNNPVLIGEPGVGKTAIVEVGTANCCGRCSGQLERQTSRDARSRCVACRSEVPRRIRRASESRTARSPGRIRQYRSVH